MSREARPSPEFWSHLVLPPSDQDGAMQGTDVGPYWDGNGPDAPFAPSVSLVPISSVLEQCDALSDWRVVQPEMNVPEGSIARVVGRTDEWDITSFNHHRRISTLVDVVAPWGSEATLIVEWQRPEQVLRDATIFEIEAFMCRALDVEDLRAFAAERWDQVRDRDWVEYEVAKMCGDYSDLERSEPIELSDPFLRLAFWRLIEHGHAREEGDIALAANTALAVGRYFEAADLETALGKIFRSEELRLEKLKEKSAPKNKRLADEKWRLVMKYILAKPLVKEQRKQYETLDGTIKDFIRDVKNELVDELKKGTVDTEFLNRSKAMGKLEFKQMTREPSIADLQSLRVALDLANEKLSEAGLDPINPDVGSIRFQLGAGEQNEGDLKPRIDVLEALIEETFRELVEAGEVAPLRPPEA